MHFYEHINKQHITKELVRTRAKVVNRIISFHQFPQRRNNS